YCVVCFSCLFWLLLVYFVLHICFFFFFNDTATTEIYTLSYTTLFRSLVGLRALDADGLPGDERRLRRDGELELGEPFVGVRRRRSEEHTSELQSPCNLVCRLLLEKKK